MRRRRRREPLWPVILVVAVLAVGLGVGSVLTGPDVPVEMVRDRPDDDAMADSSIEIPSPEDRIRVEVLNGAGVAGMASRATELLRDRGFDVVFFGNEASFGREASVVLDRTARGGALDSVGRSLGIMERRAETDSTRLVDITVLLGTDWEDREISAPPSEAAAGEATEESPPWWDVRRFLQRGR